MLKDYIKSAEEQYLQPSGTILTKQASSEQNKKQKQKNKQTREQKWEEKQQYGYFK